MPYAKPSRSETSSTSSWQGEGRGGGRTSALDAGACCDRQLATPARHPPGGCRKSPSAWREDEFGEGQASQGLGAAIQGVGAAPRLEWAHPTDQRQPHR